MLHPKRGVLSEDIMRRSEPFLKTTKHSPDLREWVPSDFCNFLKEVEHLSKQCDGDDPVVLFRGHADSDWLLDCTLVRSLLKKDNVPTDEYPRSLRFHTQVVDALLTKFGRFWQPSQESVTKGCSHGIDPWYELMKRFQQYGEEDSFTPKGTFLIDWTLDRDIALYFATYVGKGISRRPRWAAGAVWVCDPLATGKVLQTRTLADLLGMMRADEFRLKAERTLPLIVHPPKQTRMLRASHQRPVYLSQMDFRYDLADAWCSVERTSDSAVFRKIILKESLLQESIAHLEKNGITEGHVYPE